MTAAVRPTLVVRTLMKANGKNHVFTNLYETCRTVKCYGTPANSAALAKQIETTLGAMNVPYTIKFTPGARNSYAGGPSMIVRLPL